MKEWLASLATSAAWPGAEFWSAIAGAIVGGIIAYVIQRQERNAARKDRQEERKLEARSLGYSLLFKVISIHTTLTHLKAHVDERLTFGKSVEIDNVASVLLPIANMPSPVEFTSPEMGMLLSLKDDAVFNSVVSLDKIHNSIIPIWTIYEVKRSAIPSQGEEHSFDASEGKGEFSVRRGSHLEAMIFEVEGIARELVRRSEVDLAEAGTALAKLVPLLNDRLQLGVGVNPK